MAFHIKEWRFESENKKVRIRFSQSYHPRRIIHPYWE